VNRGGDDGNEDGNGMSEAEVGELPDLTAEGIATRNSPTRRDVNRVEFERSEILKTVKQAMESALEKCRWNGWADGGLQVRVVVASFPNVSDCFRMFLEIVSGSISAPFIRGLTKGTESFRFSGISGNISNSYFLKVITTGMPFFVNPSLIFSISSGFISPTVLNSSLIFDEK